MDGSTLPSLFDEACRRGADRLLAVADNGQPRLTYGAAAAQVAAVAGGLQAAGVKGGDRVLLGLPRGTEEFIAAWAALRLGAVVVRAPDKATPAQIAHLIADAEPAAMIVPEAGGGIPAGRGGAVRVLPWSVLAAAAPLPSAAAGPAPGDLAALCYTSGSTGAAKGVKVSHGNFIAATHRIAAYLQTGADDRVSALLPLSAPWGVLQWAGALRAGGSVALPPATRFPGEIAAHLRRAEVTSFSALSFTWTQLVAWALDRGETLPGVRTVASSGGALSRATLEGLPRVFPQARIFLTYGLAEAFRTTVVAPEWYVSKLGSLGRPCPGVDVVIVGEDGLPVTPGQPGELVHRGDCVTLGYWRRTGATASAFRPCPAGDPAKAALPAHYSGDLVTEDADGFLWFAGRRDAQIKTGGHRVSPDEIERAAEASGLVRHAVAWGRPDEELGQAIMLAVEATGEGCTAAALHRHFGHALPSHFRPREIVLWAGPMPLTSAGKIDRMAVVARAPIGG